MKINSLSDIGIKRKDNQDNFWSAIAEINGVETGIVCVCDGMGGLNNGGLASKIVVQAVAEGFKEGTPFKELEEIIHQANSNVYNLGVNNGSKMGTTCTLIQCSSGKYQILHIGDSRCYKLKGNELMQLTKDHSAVKEYKLSPEKDYDYWLKYRNSLTRCIGVKPEIKIDYYEGTYQEGDKFIVCSDGLWHYFDKFGFRGESILYELPRLISRCIESGETDNITISILSI